MLVKEKLLTIGIALNNVLFLFLYVSLSFFNRPAHDDFFSLFVLRQETIFQAIAHQYSTFCTRFGGLFISFGVSSISSPNRYFYYNLFLACVFIVGIYRLLKILIPNYSKKRLVSYSILLFSAIFYTSLNKGETWFWLSSSSSYALGVGMSFIGIATLFSQKRNIFTTIVCIISFFAVGCLHEVYALLLIIGLALLLLFSKRLHFSRNRKLKLFLSFVSIPISFGILLAGPGNQVREAFFKEISLPYSAILNFKMVGIIYFKHLIYNSFYFILFGILFAFLFQKEWKKLQGNHPKWKLIFISILFFGTFCYLFQWPLTYKVQDIAAIRLLLPETILLLILVSWLFSIAFANFGKQKTSLFIVFFCFIGFQIFENVHQIKVARNYANTYDKRIEFLKEKEKSGNKDLVVLSPLPNSGWLYSAEISSNSAHFNNIHTQQGLNLHFPIASENN